jgi:hypothetical protein
MKTRGLRCAGGVACTVEKINAYMSGEGKTAKERKEFEVIGAVMWVIHMRTELRYGSLAISSVTSSFWQERGETGVQVYQEDVLQ